MEKFSQHSVEMWIYWANQNVANLVCSFPTYFRLFSGCLTHVIDITLSLWSMLFHHATCLLHAKTQEITGTKFEVLRPFLCISAWYHKFQTVWNGPIIMILASKTKYTKLLKQVTIWINKDISFQIPKIYWAQNKQSTVIHKAETS